MKAKTALEQRSAVRVRKAAATQRPTDEAGVDVIALREEGIRLIYSSCSPASASDEQRAADVTSILVQARENNARLGITGLLLTVNGHYLQVLEGPRRAVDALFKRIEKDARHGGVSLLLRTASHAPIFPMWSMGLVERSEPESATASRMLALRERLSEDAAVSVADFFRLLLVPGAASLALQPPITAMGSRIDASRESVTRVAFASPTALWSAAVLQHVASQSMLRLGRTSVTDPAGTLGRTLIEYLDVDAPGIGPLRALSLIGNAAACAPLALLVERLSVLVFMLAPSDLGQFVPYMRAWLALPQVAESQPAVLILTGLPPERVRPVVDAVRVGSELTIATATVKLSDAGAVWKVVQAALLNTSVGQKSKPATRNEAGPLPPEAELDLDLTQAALEVAPLQSGSELGPAGGVPPIDPSLGSELVHMLDDSGCLQELLALPGALYAAVLDAENAESILCAPDSEAVRRAALEDATFLCAKRRLVRALDADETTEDIVLTTRSQFQVFRSVRKRPALFLAVTLEAGRVEQAVVRMKLCDVESTLNLLPL